MKLSEWLQEPENRDTVYKYVGEVWGPEPDTMRGGLWSQLLTQDCPEFDGDMIEDPTRGRDSGYYVQSWNVHYTDGGLCDERVLKEEWEMTEKKIVRLTKEDNESLRWALTATGGDDRPVLSGVFVTEGKIVSTDGFMVFAAELQGESELAANDGEILKGKVASSATIVEMEEVEGKYPDYESMIGGYVRDGVVAEVAVSSRRLVAALKGMAKGDNDGVVVIRFYGETKPIEVIGRHKDGSGMYSMIMPMRLDRYGDEEYRPRWRPVKEKEEEKTKEEEPLSDEPLSDESLS